MAEQNAIRWDVPLDDLFTVEDIAKRLPEKYREALRRNIKEKIESGKQIRIMCDGVYDMFHLGHARSLEQAKKMLPTKNVWIIAGICADDDVLGNKGQFVIN